MRQKHGLLLFIATCIPGCGQMHQGYMKRGVSLMLAFCTLLAIAFFINLGELCIFLPLIWLYSFFDSYNLRSRIAEGTEPEDAFLFGLSDMDSAKLSALCRKRHSLIGWALVFLGVYMSYGMVVDWIFNIVGYYFDLWWLREILLYGLPRLVVTVLIIVLGLWFIRGPKKEADDDIPAFVPPAEEARSPETEAAGEEVPHHDESV